jgi:dTDP-glucose 4,6-dehydratase
MKLLVTGGAGFIGSNYVRLVLSSHDDVEVVNVDKLTYAGNLENLKAIEGDPRYRFVKADIGVRDDVNEVVGSESFDAIVNFAAESHVDRSLHHGVEAFIQTNTMGTQYLLDAAREYKVPRFLQVSTDEVYGSLGPQGRFSEQSPIQPNNPYAATKAGADFLVRAAHRSHKLDAVMTRCSNNFGPYQFPEKLIPLMISNAREDKVLPVYGDGLHVRDWIFVMDHCSAIDTVLRKAKPGSVYNVGGDHDVPNIEIVQLILKLLEKPDSLIKYVEDRPGHDRRYAMDSSLIREELGWVPQVTFEKALQETVDWYLSHEDWLTHIRSGAYMAYYDGMYAERLADAE